MVAKVFQAAKKKALETLAKKLKEMLAEQEKADRRAARAATAAGAGLPPARSHLCNRGWRCWGIPPSQGELRR